MDAKPDEQPSGKQARGSKRKKRSLNPEPKVDTQPYDNITKALFGLDGTQIIPELLAEVRVVDAQNVEIDRSKLRADLVFKIFYRGLIAILNLELQSRADSKLGSRLLQYLAGLHDFYNQLPVLCAVLYLFRCQVEMPPYIIECADKRSITFDYDVIRLWEVESDWIVNRQLVPLYILLPGTKAPTVDLLKKALQEMFQVYDRHEIRYRFRWFRYILRRTDTVSEEDKQIIEKEFEMQFNYKELIEDDPIVQELFAEKELKSRAEGKVEGLQESILNFLQARFPALAATPQVQQTVASIQDLEKLELIQQGLYIALDEQTARRFLKLPAQEDLL